MDPEYREKYCATPERYHCFTFHAQLGSVFDCNQNLWQIDFVSRYDCRCTHGLH
ncbi:hypothetical protein L208DRAFT_1386100 [Tricholoma matsutake]|nr:hypothetical protein L208DRAFT_1386100 [Tricholoma matsutake 945]